MWRGKSCPAERSSASENAGRKLFSPSMPVYVCVLPFYTPQDTQPKASQPVNGKSIEPRVPGLCVSIFGG